MTQQNIQNIQRTFKIEITDEYQMKCSLVDENSFEIPIELEESIQMYFPTLQLEMNRMIIGKSNENHHGNSINYVEELINSPEEYKFYPISYQEREYQVILEVLLALIVDSFKEKVEKEYILRSTEVIFPIGLF